MNIIWAVIKHEIQKLMKDRKTLLSMIFVPLISGMLIALLSQIDTEKSSDYTVYVIGAEAAEQSIENGGVTIHFTVWNGSADELLANDIFKKTDICFDMTDGIIYYNQHNANSCSLKMLVESMLENNYFEAFCAGMGTKVASVEYVDFSKDINAGVKMMAIYLPYMLIILLFTNVTNYTSDSIAGEKERGVFEKTLLAPIHSSKVILGKTIAGIIIGVVSTTLYMIVVFATSMGSSDMGLMSGVSLSAREIIPVVLYALLITYLFATILVLCSLYARNAKEARSYALPVMGVSLIMAIFSMLRTGAPAFKMYLLPIYNVCIVLQDILMGKADAARMLAVAGSLLFCSAIVFLISTKVYYSEKVRC